MLGSMIDFWEGAVAPCLARAKPAMITLVGSQDTRLAQLLLDATEDWAGTVHVIDPVPLAGEGALRARGADRIVIHRARAQDALSLLPVADVLLLDIDPNWYTTQLILTAISAQCTRLRRPFPATLLTNTAWPYARRDCYADPGAIPERFRHPHETAGVRPGQSALCASRGLFADREHASEENGPRNGVLTALEDYAAAEGGRISTLTVPLLHGISLIHDAACVSDAARELHEALRMGPAARALAEAVDLERSRLAIEIADRRREVAAADYLAGLLRETLLREREADMTGRSVRLPLAALATTALRKVKTAARLALRAARGEVGGRDAAAAGIARLRASPIFDAAWYLDTYGDVAATGSDPAEHFYHHGAAELRDPGPLFSTAFYLDSYRDVAEARINPLLHYLQTGAQEGRDPSPFFSSSYYLEEAKKIVQPGVNPLEHYITIGLLDGLRCQPPP